jgi:sigma-B regulation protein RsbU (phosphoserine phosphatase)
MSVKVAEKEITIESLQQQLQLKQSQLNALLEISQAINNNLSADGLMQLYANVLRDEMGINKMAIYTHYDNWDCSICYGLDMKLRSENIFSELKSFTQISNLKKSKHPLAAYYEIVIPTYHKNNPLAITFLGDLGNLKGESFEERMNFVQTITNIITVAIENKKLFKEQLNQQGLKKEMELAGQMQTMLIPEVLPSDERIDMDALYMPHLDVGGDYYDCMELNEDEFMFCIGDISGHGIAAALLMANFQSSLRSLIMQQESLKDFIVQFNQKVNEITRGEKFITLFLAKYNWYNRTLQYINAGHTSPLLFQNNEIIQLDKGCTILGMFEKLPSITSGTITLVKDAFLLCYTDGLIELENEKEEQFQMKRLQDFVIENRNKNVKTFNKDLLDNIIKYKGKALFNDDISILTCRIF